MTERVTFPSSTQDTASGALALPAGADKAPAVVVIQEWWGLNEQIKATAERWAAEGFVALVPDLYRGALAKDAAEAEAMMNGLDRPRALADIAGAVAYLRTHARATGTVGVTGYCMGGALTLATSTRVPRLSAAVAFYGIGGENDWSKVDAPLMLHVGGKDGWVTPERAAAVQAELEAAGKSLEVHVYPDSDHAFCNDKRPEVFDPDACALAWKRTVAFMRQHSA